MRRVAAGAGRRDDDALPLRPHQGRAARADGRRADGRAADPEDELPDDWREGSPRSRRAPALFIRHPWVARASDRRPGRAERHAPLRAVARRRRGTGLDVAEQLELVALVDDYVFGHALRTPRPRATPPRPTAEAPLEASSPTSTRSSRRASSPHLPAFAGGDPAAAWSDRARWSRRGAVRARAADRLLDGLELEPSAAAGARRSSATSRRSSPYRNGYVATIGRPCAPGRFAR